MAKRKIHPLYIVFLAVMLLLAVLGLVLLIGGSLQPRPQPLWWMVPELIAPGSLYG